MKNDKNRLEFSKMLSSFPTYDSMEEGAYRWHLGKMEEAYKKGYFDGEHFGSYKERVAKPLEKLLTNLLND